MIAQELLLASPGSVRSAVLAFTAAAAGPLDRRLLQLWIELAASGEPGYHLAVRDGYFHGFSPGYLASHALELDRALSSELLQLPARHGFVAQLEAALGHDATSRVGRIGVPTLVLQAELDGVFPAPASELLASSIPNAQREVLACGHAAMLELPTRFAEVVTGYLNGLKGRTPSQRRSANGAGER
jgi:pimeloyl-ACP methyl ester carboxylesterase